AWGVTFLRGEEIGFTCKVTRFSLQSEQQYASRTKFRDRFKGDRLMQKVITVLILGLGVLGASSLPRHSRLVAATSSQSTAVFDAEGKLKLPEGYRHWVFIGAPLTPNGLNNGKAGFPEYHHVYVEEKNLDVYLKTGSFPEGTVLVKELTRVLNPTFPDASPTNPSPRAYSN